MTTPSDAPEITIVICTRNRAEQLGNVLNSAVQLRAPDGLLWEFLIVDNGSTDATAEVVKSYQDRLPIRLVREERAGLSNARNKGVAEAAGRYICWTDDDVVLDPEWLAAYWAAFKRHPEAAIFGGRIIPVLETPTPAWFEKLRGEWPVKILLAMRDFGDEPRLLDFPTGVIPFGANFAVKTVDQRKVAYEPGLGVSPNHRRVGEEAEMIFRLMSGGATGWWVPASKVRHMISTQRQSWDYIYDYAQSYGETLAYLERTWPRAHHLASAASDLARVNHGPAHLAAGAALYRAFSSLRRRTGDPRRAAELLAVAGLYSGAARFARNTNSRRGGLARI
jgi:glycosyltransferase involved in cell wall biosynthesis